METKDYEMGFWHCLGITNIIITAGGGKKDLSSLLISQQSLNLL